MTLRAADVSEEVITGFRVHKIKNGATFAAMDTTVEELKVTIREALTQSNMDCHTKWNGPTSTMPGWRRKRTSKFNDVMGGSDILIVISLLERIRSGWLNIVSLLLSASTWSRTQNYGDGQKPFWSRADPCGLQDLDPLSLSRIAASNQQLEFISWSRLFKGKVGVTMVFPEDLDGKLESGPSSFGTLREFKKVGFASRRSSRRAEYLC